MERNEGMKRKYEKEEKDGSIQGKNDTKDGNEKK